ncbi:glutamate ABC transporter substrate-binding protein [Corynebacterium pacaense]|uniref:glutamate ABC transporter substrate-binding protein n=1 Tax=Corynebacterium pacaense TaxID=1816684 RepID=UPI0009BB0D3E|nr:glutamate ABC transporter substrate-binding protein [Corynebacterium pacaense]
MTISYRRPHRRVAATVAACALAACSLTACAGPTPESPVNYNQLDPGAGPPLPPDSELEAAGSVAPQEIVTDTWEGSLRPDSATPEERVPTIFKRGRIIVGVDQSQNLLSFRDSLTGTLQGFEVSLAKEIARDIFGDPEAVDFRYVDSIDRVRALQQGNVDIVIRSMAVTEDRAKQVEFSTPYYRAQTRLLVMDNSGITSVADLAGHTICVAEGSTALQRARAIAPESDILKTRNWADCLMALQQQQAQVILGDDVILSGIAAQDPYTRILPASLGLEYYGVATAKQVSGRDVSGLVRQINSTLERLRNDGTWWNLFNQWFAPYLTSLGPPALQFREENPDE